MIVLGCFERKEGRRLAAWPAREHIHSYTHSLGLRCGMGRARAVGRLHLQPSSGVLSGSTGAVLL